MTTTLMMETVDPTLRALLSRPLKLQLVVVLVLVLLVAAVVA